MAMINVDFASPSLVLGIALIGCGVALLQVSSAAARHHELPQLLLLHPGKAGCFCALRSNNARLISA
jgi:hypothetical protein